MLIRSIAAATALLACQWASANGTDAPGASELGKMSGQVADEPIEGSKRSKPLAGSAQSSAMTQIPVQRYAENCVDAQVGLAIRREHAGVAMSMVCASALNPVDVRPAVPSSQEYPQLGSVNDKPFQLRFVG